MQEEHLFFAPLNLLLLLKFFFPGVMLLRKSMDLCTLTPFICTGELYAVACSPTDATLVATGGGDDKGFLWRIGQGDWAFELQGMCMTW